MEQNEIKINRRFFWLCAFVVITIFMHITIANTFPTIDQHIEYTDKTSSNWKSQTDGELVKFPLIGLIAALGLPFIIMAYLEAEVLDEEATTKEIYKKKIPEIERLFDMNCIMCNGKIDQPNNIIKHLGIDQTVKYLKFCDDSNSIPNLYCCGCYATVEKTPNWQKAMDDMIANAIKYGELKKQYEDKLQMISQ